MLSRRSFVGASGSFLAGLTFPLGCAFAQPVTEIQMRGNADGSQVWFDPIGILIRPGQSIRWINKDPGNSHTSTAYHPANKHPLRIPGDGQAWDSDYLLPDESFVATFTAEGVYDYFCLPHEHAGMVGRIVVGRPKTQAGLRAAELTADLPEEVLRAFPSVERIVQEGVIRPL